MTPKKEANLKNYFKETVNRSWQICRCGGGKEEIVKNDLNFLSLCGLSGTMGQSRLCGSDEFSLGVLNLKDYVPYSYWGIEIWNLEALVRAFSE